MKKSVRMADIAERLGVSVAAVSKALADKPGISPELRVRVRQTALEIGYKAAETRKKTQRSATKSVAVVTAERFLSDDSFYLKYYKHISDMLQSNDYCGFFYSISAEDETNLVLPKALVTGSADGVIILGKISGDYTELIASCGVPLVFLDYYDERTEIDCIICDSFYAAYDMTNYLIRNGHKRIAFVGSVKATGSIQDRYLGYVKSLMEHDIYIRSDYLIEDRDERGMLRLGKLPEDLPTAFVCNCDGTAAELVKHLRESGVRVPEDVSVTGFDNSVYSSICDPKITTVEVNTEQMSRLAVDSLLKKIAKPGTSIGRIRVNGTIVYKNSVRALKK